ncbi:MAG: hypothetical protein V7723_18405, partial [Sneathiella sp.]|uniref:hypothetical protein n=1 Tax=Sneathiella sp. TaxID=1964365 RepID=UPI0030032DCB
YQSIRMQWDRANIVAIIHKFWRGSIHPGCERGATVRLVGMFETKYHLATMRIILQDGSSPVEERWSPKAVSAL